MPFMQKLIAGIYHAFIGLFTKKNSEFSTYVLEIFSNVWWLTVLSALVLVLVYYYVFNTPSTVLGRTWNSLSKWLMTMLLVSGAGTWLAYYFSLKHGVDRSQYLGYFMIVNALVGALWFLLWSVALKRKSTQAWTTPFPWPAFSR
jgi:hypothetical protein